MFKNLQQDVAIIILFTCSCAFFFISASALLSTFSFDFDNAAAVYLVDDVTVEGLKKTYEEIPVTQDKVRIFVMPGHEPDYGGAEYGRIKERDLSVVLGRHLTDFLNEQGSYEAVMGRDEDSWHPELEEYFETDEDEIIAWKEEQQETMDALIADGSFEEDEDPIPHQTAAKDPAIRLYGINKWIGENDFDLAVHIHFNDYGSHRRNRPGKYSGFVIYVPDGQYSNSDAAKAVAQSVRERLGAFIAESDTPREKGGIVESQELIALGSNNTADAPSLLVEYGYIYESQFQDKEVSDVLLREYAYQTFLAIEDFFKTGVTFAYKTSVLPHEWKGSLERGTRQDADVLALQFTLLADGLYPPEGKDFHQCPLSGIFGSCTVSALKAFQEKNGIEGDGTVVGPKTRALLNGLFGE